MRTLVKILILLFISIKVFATPQDSETLIYGNDTMYIDVFPLEILMNHDEVLHKKIMDASECMQTSCWRGHHGTWKIVNDSLFLVKLEDGCQENELEISKFFDDSKISNNGVFAHWFSNSLKANYGRYLDFNETTWTSVYEGEFKCNVTKGKISNVTIEMKDSNLINNILKEKSEKEDTMVCLVVDTYPILIAKGEEYKYTEIKEFVKKHIRYPANGNDCEGSVYISVLIEKDGSVSEKKFVRKVCQGYDEEAMKVVDLMVKWKPGLIKGQPVRTRMVLPLRWRYE